MDYDLFLIPNFSQGPKDYKKQIKNNNNNNNATFYVCIYMYIYVGRGTTSDEWGKSRREMQSGGGVWVGI